MISDFLSIIVSSLELVLVVPNYVTNVNYVEHYFLVKHQLSKRSTKPKKPKQISCFRSFPNHPFNHKDIVKQCLYTYINISTSTLYISFILIDLNLRKH